MSRSISDADLDAVNADLLPPQARQLVRLIGMVNTLTLLEQRGGVTLRIPTKAMEAVYLRDVLPMDAIIELCKAMPGKRIELPKLDKITLQIRNQVIRAERQQVSASKVALRFNLTRRQVINICKSSGPGPQTDLFGEHDESVL